MAKKGLTEIENKDMARWHQNVAPASKETIEQSKKNGNLNALKHGLFANRILAPEEKVLFDTLIEKLYDDFQFNKSSDFLQVELVGVYSVKLMRAQMEGNADASERLDRMIRAHMRELKTTKISREGEQPLEAQTSPAEWASALLDKAAEVTDRQQKKGSDRKKPKTISDNTESEEEEPAE